MRVIVNGWFWDRPETGSGQYVRRIAEGLVAIDPTVDLTIALPFETDSLEIGPDTGHALDFIPRPSRRTNLDKVRWEQWGMPRLARRLGADLLHTPYWAPPVISPVPSVVTIHDIIPLILPAYRGHALVRLYTALVSAATSQARIVLTDSEASRSDILQRLSLPEERVRVVPLAVDDGYTDQSQPDDPEIRAALQLPESYVLYLGGFDIRKNLRGALQAFAIVRRACPATQLIVAGRLPSSDTAFNPDPRRLARESGVPEDAVSYLGFVSEREKQTLYRGTQAFLCPSLYEGFGYTALEALSCGTPVVGTAAASLPEVVGDAGLLFPPNDVAGMAGALIQLLIDDAFRAEMRARARRQSRRFSWARTARATLAAYRDAVI